MAGITQNKQKCLIFVVVPQDRTNFNDINDIDNDNFSLTFALPSSFK